MKIELDEKQKNELQKNGYVILEDLEVMVARKKTEAEMLDTKDITDVIKAEQKKIKQIEISIKNHKKPNCSVLFRYYGLGVLTALLFVYFVIAGG